MRRARIRFHEPTTIGERAADAAAHVIGSWRFLIAQGVILMAWLVFNSIAFFHHFDPFPYILCNLALSFQAAFTGPVLLIAANRSAAIDRLRDDHEAETVDGTAAMVTQMHDLTREIHRLTLAQDDTLALLKAHIAKE